MNKNIRHLIRVSRDAFQVNECMKSISQSFKTVAPSFKVDERLVRIEISGLPLCAWGSTAFKKVASMFGKFLFFENEQTTSICTGRVCIATKCHQLISEKIQVEINNDNFTAHVQEIGTWSINIRDDYQSTQSSEEESEESKIGNSEDEYSNDGVDDIINELNENKDQKGDFPDKLRHSNKANCDDQYMEPNMDTKQQSNGLNSNEPSCPPGFENFKDDNNSSIHCSTSFARFKKKDIKGFSLINEMTRIIEVGDSLGYDVRGCRKSLKKMINGIGAHMGNYVFDYACSMSRGKSGGIISMWDPNIFVKKDIWCDESFVIVKGRWKNLDGDYFMVNIYGPQEPTEKVSLWRRIEDFIHHNNGAFVLFGDFNEVRFNYERLGSSFSQSQADVFNTFITNNNLIELPMGNRMFTWMNKSGSKLSKLDRFLFSGSAIDALPDAHVTTLDKLWSDHNPILFHCKKVDYGPTPFRFYHSWFYYDGFDDFISSEWISLGQSNTTQDLSSHEKLKSLKAKIKNWLRDTKSNEKRHKEEMIDALKHLDVKIDSNNATDEDRDSRAKILHDIDKLDRLDSLDLQQKSHIKWDIERDENSKFFHGIVNQRRRSNSIHGIMNEGIWTTDPIQVKDTFLNFFKEKFEFHDSNCDFTSAPSVSTLNDTNLEKEVTMEEIKFAVWSCGNDKAPGPDGFTFGFIKREMIDWYKKRKKKMLIFKVDFEKAFDSVSWNYLDFMLHKLGFGLTWRAWIKACLDSSTTSILVNGSPTSEFSVKRGLRQGDPLSPLLFIIVMEGLHMSLREACHSGMIHGINIGSSNITLSHMFYANDVIITTEWNTLDMDNIIRILHVFYLASGLKINIHKSNVYGVGVSDNEKTLLDKFDSRLSKWKAKLLSIGGRLTLIKSVLGSLGIYYLSIFKVSDIVLKTLEKKRGLGVGSLKSFNLALLLKWRWRMISNPNALWVKVIKSLHGQKGGFGLNVSSSKGIWSKIMGSSNFLHSNEIIPNDSIRYRVGCGSSIRFWKDLWIGNSPLYIRYNKLFRLDNEKDCFISDRFIDNQWSWNWSRAFLGTHNSAYLVDMINDITPLDLNFDRDVCYWSLSNDGMFSVRDARLIIDAHLLPAIDNHTQWEKCIPRKVNIFMWRFKLDRLPHRLNLSSRGMDIPSIGCPLCNANMESSDHLFFGCDFAKDIWNSVRVWSEASFPACFTFAHWEVWFNSWQASKERKWRLYVIFATSLWWIWRFRNSIIFGPHPLKRNVIYDNIRSFSFYWLHHRGRMACNWNDWLKSPLVVLRIS
ncbi:RNA-directed DNA polymerase, eukaryota, reverse transcriptase zinc-binding domain protein [Tanacetum coccineum]